MNILDEIKERLERMESTLHQLIGLRESIPKANSELLTVEEAAARTRVSKSHLRRLMDKGELPFTKPAKFRLIAVSDLEALLKRHEGGSHERA